MDHREGTRAVFGENFSNLVASMKFMNSVKLGAGATLGSLGVNAIFGLVALLGMLLVFLSKRKDGTKNVVLFGLGVALIVIAALPFIPIFGLSMVAESLSD